MDKLTILKYLEQLADKLRALGFHSVTRVGRHVLHLLIGDITVRVGGSRAGRISENETL